MRKLFLLFLILGLFGCNKGLSFNEIGMEKADKDIIRFISENNENGVYLFQDGKKTLYIYLNGRKVQEGKNPVYFSHFDVKGTKDTVKILYNENQMNETDSQPLNNWILYKVNLDKQYEEIQVFKNEKETYFNTVSGRQ